VDVAGVLSCGRLSGHLTLRASLADMG